MPGGTARMLPFRAYEQTHRIHRQRIVGAHSQTDSSPRKPQVHLQLRLNKQDQMQKERSTVIDRDNRLLKNRTKVIMMSSGNSTIHPKKDHEGKSLNAVYRDKQRNKIIQDNLVTARRIEMTRPVNRVQRWEDDHKKQRRTADSWQNKSANNRIYALSDDRRTRSKRESGDYVSVFKRDNDQEHDDDKNRQKRKGNKLPPIRTGQQQEKGSVTRRSRADNPHSPRGRGDCSSAPSSHRGRPGDKCENVSPGDEEKDRADQQTESDAKQLFKVVKKLAPPHNIIIRTLAKKSFNQRMKTKDKFNKLYDLDLEMELKRGLGSMWSLLIECLLKDQNKGQSEGVCKSMKSGDPVALVKKLTPLSNQELADLKQEYYKENSSKLESDITKKFPVPTETLLLTLVKGSKNEKENVNEKQAEKDAKALFEFGNGRWTSNNGKFICLLRDRTPAHMNSVFNSYKNLNKGKPVTKSVQEECTKDYARVVNAYVNATESAGSETADNLHRNLDPTNPVFVKTVVARSETDIHKVREEYEKKYGNKLVIDLEKKRNHTTVPVLRILIEKNPKAKQKEKERNEGKQREAEQKNKESEQGKKEADRQNEKKTKDKDEGGEKNRKKQEDEKKKEDKKDKKDKDKEGEDEDAVRLFKAMKGFGTNEDVIIDIIPCRTNAQRQEIKARYQELFSKDLDKELQSELSGDFREVILALMVPSDQYEAECLDDALKGKRADETALIGLLCSKTPEELEKLKDTYKKNNKDLADEISKRSKGDFKNVLLQVLKGERDTTSEADKQKAETDAELIGNKFNMNVIKELYSKGSAAQIKATEEAHMKFYNKDIRESIQDACSVNEGTFYQALASSEGDPTDFYVERLYNSMKGIGANKSQLIRILVSRSEVDLPAINENYQRKYGRVLRKDVESETSGDFMTTLLKLIDGAGKGGGDKKEMEETESPRKQKEAAPVKPFLEKRLNKSVVAEEEKKNDVKRKPDEERKKKEETKKKEEEEKKMQEDTARKKEEEKRESNEEKKRKEEEVIKEEEGKKKKELELKEKKEVETKKKKEEQEKKNKEEEERKKKEEVMKKEEAMKKKEEDDKKKEAERKKKEEAQKEAEERKKKEEDKKKKELELKEKKEVEAKKKQEEQEKKNKEEEERKKKEEDVKKEEARKKKEEIDKKKEAERKKKEEAQKEEEERKKKEEEKKKKEVELKEKKKVEAKKKKEEQEKKNKEEEERKKKEEEMIKEEAKKKKEEDDRKKKEETQKWGDEEHKKKNDKGKENAKVEEEEEHDEDAVRLHRAMKGLRINANVIVDIIPCRSNAERQQIKARYKELYKKDLYIELQSVLYGNLQEVILALMVPSDQYEAECLMDAMKGKGADQTALIGILCSKKPEDLDKLKETFKNNTKEDLTKEIEKSTKGEFKDILLNVLKGERDASSKTDKKKAKIDAELIGNKHNLSVLKELYSNGSAAQIRATEEAHMKLYKKDIRESIQEACSGDEEKFYLALSDPTDFYVQRLHSAMKGFRTNDSQLITILVSRSEVDLSEMKGKYQKIFGSALRKDVQSKTNGDYRGTLLKLIDNAGKGDGSSEKEEKKTESPNKETRTKETGIIVGKAEVKEAHDKKQKEETKRKEDEELKKIEGEKKKREKEERKKKEEERKKREEEEKKKKEEELKTKKEKERKKKEEAEKNKKEEERNMKQKAERKKKEEEERKKKEELKKNENEMKEEREGEKKKREDEERKKIEEEIEKKKEAERKKEEDEEYRKKEEERKKREEDDWRKKNEERKKKEEGQKKKKEEDLKKKEEEKKIREEEERKKKEEERKKKEAEESKKKEVERKQKELMVMKQQEEQKTNREEKKKTAQEEHERKAEEDKKRTKEEEKKKEIEKQKNDSGKQNKVTKKEKKDGKDEEHEEKQEENKAMTGLGTDEKKKKSGKKAIQNIIIQGCFPCMMTNHDRHQQIELYNTFQAEEDKKRKVEEEKKKEIEKQKNDSGNENKIVKKEKIDAKEEKQEEKEENKAMTGLDTDMKKKIGMKVFLQIIGSCISCMNNLESQSIELDDTMLNQNIPEPLNIPSSDDAETTDIVLQAAETSRGNLNEETTKEEEKRAETPKSSAENTRAEKAARELYGCMMNAFESDEEGIVNIITNQSNKERQKTKAKYHDLYKKDLVSDLGNKLSGYLKETILALMMPPLEYDAYCLHEALRGLGANDAVLIGMLFCKKAAELEDIKKTYKKLYSNDLLKDIKKVTNGDYRDLLLQLASTQRNQSSQVDEDRADQDAKTVHDAPSIPVFTEVFVKSSRAHVKAVAEAHERLFDTDIVDSIGSCVRKKDTSYYTYDAIVNSYSNETGYYAYMMNHAIYGLGTDSLLIMLIVSNSETDLPDVQKKYQHLFSRSLREVVNNDVSGEHRKALVTLLDKYRPTTPQDNIANCKSCVSRCPIFKTAKVLWYLYKCLR